MGGLDEWASELPCRSFKALKVVDVGVKEPGKSTESQKPKKGLVVRMNGGHDEL